MNFYGVSICDRAHNGPVSRSVVLGTPEDNTLAVCEVQALQRQVCRLKPFPLVGEPVRQFAFAHLK